MAQRSSSRVMMLTGSPNASTMRAAALAGAVGFLPKDCGANRLVSAVRAVAAGGTAWPDQAPACRPALDAVTGDAATG
jgi:DNA-binding NarL/FixJ family response regulator